jgi:hypothetical protein
MVDHRAVVIAVVMCAVRALSAVGLEQDESVVELLKRAKAKIVANASDIENYVCVETINRTYFRPMLPPGFERECSSLLRQTEHPTPQMELQLEATDRLRLDVAATARGEIFSWAGSSSFGDGRVDTVVRYGPMSTGAFRTYLTIIFTDAKRFTVDGPRVVDGRNLIGYSFNVLQSDSHYRALLPDGTGFFIAYTGSVLVDPESADPVHVTVRTAELPAATGACESLASLDYQRTKIGTRELLLPSAVRQRFISRRGYEVENTTSVSACHEYSSESTITFFDKTEDQSVTTFKTVPLVSKTISPGLHFGIELTAPIVTDTAAAGDRFTGKLTEPLRDGHRVLAPKGALVEGRITGIKIYYGLSPRAAIALSPRHIEINGTKMPLLALLDSRAAVLANQKNRKKGAAIVLPPVGEYSGIFEYPGQHVTMKPGFVSRWVTARDSHQ